MTPADVIEKALRKHMRLRTGDMMSGAEIRGTLDPPPELLAEETAGE